MNRAAAKFVTVNEWLALPDDERAELIEGEIVRRVSPSAEHSITQLAIGRALAPFYGKGGGDGPGGWWLLTEAQVVYEGRPNGFIHDLAGWRRDRHPEKPKGKRIVRKPDWVCAILSGNRKHDLTTKKWVLHEHRVEYLWMVDVESEVLSVLRWTEKGYVALSDVSSGEKARLEPFESIELDVGILFGGDPD